MMYRWFLSWPTCEFDLNVEDIEKNSQDLCLKENPRYCNCLPSPSFPPAPPLIPELSTDHWWIRCHIWNWGWLPPIMEIAPELLANLHL